MNYIGSKHTLSDFIVDTITDVIGIENLKNITFCDMFAGTGIIGRKFKNKVNMVISNDIEYYSYVLNRNYIENNSKIKDVDYYINYLNNLPGVEGFIYKNYCLGGHGVRQYFSDENGKKIDSIRQKIEKLKDVQKTRDLYYHLLASLIECSDKIANTTSVYGAHLKYLKESAKKTLILKPAEFDITPKSGKHVAKNIDSNELVNTIKGHILYLDPPYNERQYGSNYHLLNTIAIYDEFIPKGKTGLRKYTPSKYSSKNTVKQEFEDLINKAKFNYIFLSYNNEGLMTGDEIKEIMSKYGKYELYEKEYRRFKADTKRNYSADKTIECLHFLEKELH
ncbi:MAG: DNA adenine methylase [Mycoplasmataceae bacterium]|jgi:adenine-specific DNA-methyltransferase|nr:DNA adenine methylase [Mycoplasmataceae bacterium]